MSISVEFSSKVPSEVITFCVLFILEKKETSILLGLLLNPHTESPYFHMGYCFIGLFSGNSLLGPPGSENISKACFKRNLPSAGGSEFLPLNPTRFQVRFVLSLLCETQHPEPKLCILCTIVHFIQAQDTLRAQAGGNQMLPGVCLSQGASPGFT